MGKIRLLPIFLIAFWQQLPLLSHDLTDLHRFCLSANDYPGCFSTQLSDDKLDLTSDTNYPEFRKYGPLRINWTSWRSKNGNYVAAATNMNNQNIFLAINCSQSMINVTGIQNRWKGWSNVQNDFEAALLKDLCNLN